MSFRIRLAAILSFTVLIPIAVSVVLVAAVLPGRLDQQVRARVSDGLVATEQQVAQACTRLNLTAQLLGVLGLAEPAAAAVSHVVGTGAASWAELVDGHGRVLAAAGSGDGGAPSLRATGNCRANGAAGMRELVASFAASDPQGAVDRATVAAPVRSLAVVPGIATVVAAGRTPLLTVGVPAPSAAALAAAVARQPRAGSVGDLLVAAAGPGPGRPFTLIEAAPQPNVSQVQLLAVAVLLGALGLAFLLGRQLATIATGPLVQLAEAADRFAGGDLDAGVPVRSRDEIGRLASAFNAMTEGLRNHIRELQRSRDEVRRGAIRLGEAIARTHDLNGLLEVILDSCRASLRARAGAVFLTDVHGDLQAVVGVGMADQSRLVGGEGVAGAVAVRGTRLAWPGEDAAVAPAAAEPARTAALAVPIRRRGQVFGVLALYDRLDGTTFSADDLDTAASLAAQANTAVENVLLHDEARRLAITDSLTGLWNRRYFVMNVGKEIERAARFGRPLALLMLDLDHFKAVNDTYGHPRGDEVLTELATRVKGQIREVDMLARYGGEELVLVLPETDANGASRTAERIGAVIRDTEFGLAGGVPVRLTVSIGAAVFPTAGTTPDELVAAADAALYAAKAAGRDCWRLVGDPAASAPDAVPVPVPVPAPRPRSGDTPTGGGGTARKGSSATGSAEGPAGGHRARAGSRADGAGRGGGRPGGRGGRPGGDGGAEAPGTAGGQAGADAGGPAAGHSADPTDGPASARPTGRARG